MTRPMDSADCERCGKPVSVFETYRYYAEPRPITFEGKECILHPSGRHAVVFRECEHCGHERQPIFLET